MRCYAERGIAMASCLSVRPSVMFRYRGHIGWNSWKIVSRLIKLTFLLSINPNITELLQSEHLQILAGILNWGTEKLALGVQIRQYLRNG